jgi:hypothetical protein
MNGEDFMFSTSGSFDVQVYHHSLTKKSINKVHTLRVSLIFNNYYRNTQLRLLQLISHMMAWSESLADKIG